MSIEQEIASWDGKSATEIKAIYDTYHEDTHFSETITVLTLIKVYENGATWLLKAWLEAGNKLEPAQFSKIYRSLDQMKNWKAKLHILQSIPLMPIADAERNNVCKFLRDALTDQNKFVRAWAYNGFYELSRQHSDYTDETEQ